MKTIGVDLDDVLLNFNDAFIEFHNLKYGSSYNRSDLTTFHYMKNQWGIDIQESLKRLDDFYRSEHHIKSLPVDGSVDAMTELLKNNVIHIVTASPEEFKENILAWLNVHFGDKFKNIHFIRKTIFDGKAKNKRDICKELNIEVFIDDAIHNAEDIISGNIPVILLDTPWNQGYEGSLITRAYSWADVTEVLKKP
ncbi:MAG: uncharacterized protein JWL80_269 [Parcubacteria group bacterium]|nr:uncharacterized protein [Parcubacteria group bacterium]